MRLFQWFSNTVQRFGQQHGSLANPWIHLRVRNERVPKSKSDSSTDQMQGVQSPWYGWHFLYDFEKSWAFQKWNLYFEGTEWFATPVIFLQYGGKSSHYSKSSFLVQKFNFDFQRKNVELFWVKTRENAAVLYFLAVDSFDFTRKKFWVKNSWKCWGFCQHCHSFT